MNRPLAVNKVILGIVAVVAVLVLIAVLVHVSSREKVGSTDNPRAQRAALSLLQTIPVKGRAPKTGYSRFQFGQPWTDDVDIEGGHNHCDTRNDILRRDLSNVVPPSGCIVQSGVLHDPYTGNDIRFNRDEGTDVLVQVDHVVALLDAWQKGAQQWDQPKRTQFANDPVNLLAVSGKANRNKKASDVATWLPSNKDFRCAYVTRVVDVKAKYGVWMTQDEHDAALRILTACLSQPPLSSKIPSSSGVLPSVGTRFPSSSRPAPLPLVPPPPQTSTQYVPPPAALPPSDGPSVYYPNCKAARAAGAAPIYRGQPGYRPGLDRDGDGVACE
ncbi:excalibur calcium-binding domain-containing protein [Mycobacterium sp.]|uniref:excalibur calcium-binding domain-containing protein n=2 Tax=Mycobacterium sp. TaxID=1785 RepID=UPI003BB4A175